MSIIGFHYKQPREPRYHGIGARQKLLVNKFIAQRATGRKTNEKAESVRVSGPPKQRATHSLTIAHKLKQGQVNLPLPRGAFLEGNSVTSGGKDVSTPDGHQLAAFVPPGLVIQDRRIVDERVQLPATTRNQGVTGMAGGLPSWGTAFAKPDPESHAFTLEMTTHSHSILSS